jgi:glutathione synthase/RimK-type ligase-like ATP-grasp enzyme
MRVAFLTFDGEPDIAEDDRAALPALAARGIDVEPAIWDRPDLDLGAYDAVVLRSCWDYHRKPDAFLRLLGDLERIPLAAHNPPAVCTWNVHKGYLLDLARRGVRIPETRLVPRGSRLGDRDVIERSGALVVKPAISLNGDDTFVFDEGSAREAAEAVNALAQKRDVMLQAFVSEIHDAGELSLVFFDGAFSHAVKKLPRAGEFRVQVEHGGTRSVVTPPAAVVEEAQRILEMAGPRLLYGRVDVVPTSGGIVLMELEVLDPTLFLELDERAPDRFAAALEARLRSPR